MGRWPLCSAVAGTPGRRVAAREQPAQEHAEAVDVPAAVQYLITLSSLQVPSPPDERRTETDCRKNFAHFI
jgi:hypothetical protein